MTDEQIIEKVSGEHIENLHDRLQRFDVRDLREAINLAREDERQAIIDKIKQLEKTAQSNDQAALGTALMSEGYAYKLGQYRSAWLSGLNAVRGILTERSAKLEG